MYVDVLSSVASPLTLTTSSRSSHTEAIIAHGPPLFRASEALDTDRSSSRPTFRPTMCSYTFSYYYCGCDYFVCYDTLEYCENRSISAHSVDIWTDDMCRDKQVTCDGISNYYCSECSEDHTLEYQLEE